MDDADHGGTSIIDPPSPGKIQASIRLRLVVTWLIVGALLFLGWMWPEPLRIHWYNLSIGVVALSLPRLRRKVPRYRGARTSVRLRVCVALVAVMLLAGLFILPMEMQAYVLAVLLVPGAIAAIYSDARLFWNPLRYLPSPQPGE
ncbi:MAG: hypothetical protein ACO1QR_12725 [Chthoniobacteraceae bacterium]